MRRLMEIEHTLQYQVRAIGHKLKNYADKKLEAHGITFEQAKLIEYVFHHEEKGVSQKDLERAFQRKGSSISSIVHNLEKNGFIERKTDAKDERKKIIRMQAKGKDVVLDFDQFFSETEHLMMKGLSSEDQVKLFAFLDTINQNLDQENKLL
ncbi:MarR family winged helix-turn-helix transcriptional regulator [Paenibacillus sp. 2TAB26]|uniref:MarR family winged helix-turn-helix transcriptional regulator n=1 Tax=Paenibacillus sp. 2TAB26 TaxID=3233005 RepID=UPI003F9BA0AF